MGHLMLSTMKKIQAALAALTLKKDGVDGKKLYIYGEAWDFGEVSHLAHQPSLWLISSMKTIIMTITESVII